MSMKSLVSRSIASLRAPLLALACTANPAAAGVPDYGFQWATITHAGNRAVNQTEGEYLYPPFNTPALIKGEVDYEYRMSVTEVTTSQWLEFVRAYAPYYTGSRSDPGFTSLYIRASSFDPDQPPDFYLFHGSENAPVTMSWYYAARYVNWLNNGKAINREAFESGVYDTSTFRQNPDGTWSAPAARAVGANFWIPTVDEWIKAGFYDPDRYGPGQEGYWQRPNRSDDPLIPGLPENGGQTMHGAPGDFLDVYPVGMYPDVHSPWGLLDVSGGVSEWLGDSSGWQNFMFAMGSSNFTDMTSLSDRLDLLGGSFANTSAGIGLRLASAVPAPNGILAFAIAAFATVHRRKRRASWAGGIDRRIARRFSVESASRAGNT